MFIFEFLVRLLLSEYSLSSCVGISGRFERRHITFPLLCLSLSIITLYFPVTMLVISKSFDNSVHRGWQYAAEVLATLANTNCHHPWVKDPKLRLVFFFGGGGLYPVTLRHLWVTPHSARFFFALVDVYKIIITFLIIG